jgi:N-acetylneuraminate synthase
MHNLSEVKEAIIHLMDIPLALLHCVSMYPAPYQNVNLNTISKWRELFPYATIGISDHTLGNYISFGAYTLGASIIERHFTVTKYWQGPDIATSIDFEGMCDLIYGLDCLFQSQGDAKDITEGEAPVIKFALARAVTNTDVKKYDEITKDNIIFKRTNNLGISAQHFNDVYGATFNKDMYKGTPVTTEDIK